MDSISPEPGPCERAPNHPEDGCVFGGSRLEMPQTIGDAMEFYRAYWEATKIVGPRVSEHRLQTAHSAGFRGMQRAHVNIHDDGEGPIYLITEQLGTFSLNEEERDDPLSAHPEIEQMTQEVFCKVCQSLNRQALRQNVANVIKAIGNSPGLTVTVGEFLERLADPQFVDLLKSHGAPFEEVDRLARYLLGRLDDPDDEPMDAEAVASQRAWAVRLLDDAFSEISSSPVRFPWLPGREGIRLAL